MAESTLTVQERQQIACASITQIADMIVQNAINVAAHSLQTSKPNTDVSEDDRDEHLAGMWQQWYESIECISQAFAAVYPEIFDLEDFHRKCGVR